MRKLFKWFGVSCAVAVAAILAAVVFGDTILKDPQGNVAFGWDKQRHRFRILEKPELMLDGPHAFRTANGYRIVDTERDGAAWRLRERLLTTEAPTVVVRVDNAAATRFEVPLRPTPSPAQAVFAQNPPRLLMVSDMEGEFDKFVALLRAQGVIDERLHWRYGTGHVALVGDFVDRGEHMVPLLWLVYRLDDEASKAGGRMHYVLGNHEQLAMSGRKKYWPRRLVVTAQALGEDGDERLFSDETVLGAWLRSKPVMAKVGDHLLVHGGVSREFLAANLDIDAANALARDHLNMELDALPPRAQAVLGRHGLTWYRGMAMPDDRDRALEADPAAHLERVLRRYSARRVAIGHTIVKDVALQRQGALLRLDVHHAEQTPQAALYENGALWRVDANGLRVALD